MREDLLPGHGVADDIADAIDELDGETEPEQAARAFLARVEQDRRFRSAVRRGLKRRQQAPAGKSMGDEDE